MITLATVEKVQSLLDLALEVHEVEQCAWKEALRRAIHLHPRLECDAMNDVRYESWPVHTSFSLPPIPPETDRPASQPAWRRRAG